MRFSDFSVPVLGFAAFSGSGKTTLLEQVIPRLKAKGIKLALVKHSHHDFELDKPGKDSYRLRKSGADQVLLASQYRRALVIEGDGKTEPDLLDLLQHLDRRELDLVLVEGFRHEPIPKIELHRPSLDTPLLCSEDERIIALVCDDELSRDVGLPLLSLNDPAQVTRFILEWLRECTE